MKNITPASLVGAAVAIPAGIVGMGWLLHEPALIRLTPGVTMVFNTAWCFFMVALALSADSLRPAWRDYVRTLSGAVATVIAGLVLGQYFSGHPLIVDWPELHRRFVDSNQYPGRMSPPTAVAFVLCGMALLLMHWMRGLWGGLLIQALTAAIIILGAIGVAGYLLNLPLVYHNYIFSQMAMSTASGFIAVGIGLWLSWRRDAWYRDRTLIHRDEQRIALNGAVALAIIVFISVLATFVVTERSLEALTTKDLSQRLKSRIDLVSVSIDMRSSRAALIATSPALTELADQLRVQPDDPDARKRLKAAAESLLPFGLSALTFADPEGTPWVSVGVMAKEPEIEVPLQGEIPAVLLWHNGFVLRVQRPMQRNGRMVGTMIVEQPLSSLMAAFRSDGDRSTSGEVVICARRESQLNCFSPRLGVAALRVPYSPELPMAHALAGEYGVRHALDYRGENVIAAHGPVDSLGIGMVVKVDTAELYSPLREHLHTVMMLMAALLAAGIALLYRNVSPLARALALSKQRLQLALAASHIALWDWDARRKRVYLSEEWERMLGRPARATAVQLDELFKIVHPDEQSALTEHLRDVLTGRKPAYDIEHRVRTQDGSWKWIRSRGKVVERGRNGRALRLVGTNADISLRKEAELRLVHRASHDVLTGLPNRSLFLDRLALAIARARRNKSLMAVMYLDIDKFKSVNDTLGHDAGDALLMQFSARLAASARATDTVARLGGDEFAIILEVLGARQDGCRIAEEIVAATRTPFILGEHTLGVTASVGIAFHAGEPWIDSDRLVKMADEALYEAKAAGRDRVAVGAAEEAEMMET